MVIVCTSKLSHQLDLFKILEDFELSQLQRLSALRFQLRCIEYKTATIVKIFTESHNRVAYLGVVFTLGCFLTLSSLICTSSNESILVYKHSPIIIRILLP